MKLVLITGASRGIGAACARLFSENGYFVAANYNKSEAEAKKLSQELKNTQCFKADVSCKDEVDSMFEQINSAFGKYPDILINNAGVSHSGLLSDSDIQDFDNIFNTNVKSVYLCSKTAVNQMIKNHSGKIINISSVWGQAGASCEVLYSASKAAVIGFTKALAKELGPCGINVNCIAPGVIKTDMLDCYTAQELDALAEETPLMRLGIPKDIARAALFLAQENSDFITGQVIGVNGGFLI